MTVAASRNGHVQSIARIREAREEVLMQQCLYEDVVKLAEVALNMPVEMETGRWPHYCNLAKAKLFLSDFEGARVACERALEDTRGGTTPPNVALILGLAQFKIGNVDKAREALEAAIACSQKRLQLESRLLDDLEIVALASLGIEALSSNPKFDGVVRAYVAAARLNMDPGVVNNRTEMLALVMKHIDKRTHPLLSNAVIGVDRSGLTDNHMKGDQSP